MSLSRLTYSLIVPLKPANARLWRPRPTDPPTSRTNIAQRLTSPPPPLCTSPPLAPAEQRPRPITAPPSSLDSAPPAGWCSRPCFINGSHTRSATPPVALPARSRTHTARAAGRRGLGCDFQVGVWLGGSPRDGKRKLPPVVPLLCAQARLGLRGGVGGGGPRELACPEGAPVAAVG